MADKIKKLSSSCLRTTNNGNDYLFSLLVIFEQLELFVKLYCVLLDLELVIGDSLTTINL